MRRFPILRVFLCVFIIACLFSARGILNSTSSIHEHPVNPQPTDFSKAGELFLPKPPIEAKHRALDSAVPPSVHPVQHQQREPPKAQEFLLPKPPKIKNLIVPLVKAVHGARGSGLFLKSQLFQLCLEPLFSCQNFASIICSFIG